MASRGGFLVGDGALRRRKAAQKSSNTAGKQAKTIKRKKKKPEWDSTVNDLGVLKASNEEIRRRHEIHLSKNTGLPLQRGSFDKENSPGKITTPNSAQRKQAILQEILYGHDRFEDVLAESDKTMSVVKDLFGDDPKKFLGFPNITMPPLKPDDDSTVRYQSGPVAEIPQTPTHLEILSDSVMRTPAINDVSYNDEGSSPEVESPAQDTTNDGPQRYSFEPRLDINRFKQYVSQEQTQHVKQVDRDLPTRHQNMNGQPGVSSKAPQTTIMSASQDSGSGSFFSGVGNNTVLAGDPNFMRQVPRQSAAEPTATVAIPPNDRSHAIPTDTSVEKPKKKEKPSKGKSKVVDQNTSAGSGLKSLDDLKKMVESLEDEIAEYEMDTGRQPSINATKQTSSFSGYTSALIMAVTKLMRYLKESEMQRRAETVMRDQIILGFSEQRALIDALTNDIIQTQELNAILKDELLSYRKTTNQQLEYLTHELHTVLKSFEYHTVQSTINALHSTKPIQLQTDNSSHADLEKEPLPGNYRPQDGTAGQKSRIQTEGAYIPVSSTADDGSMERDVAGRNREYPGHVERRNEDISKIVQPQPTVLRHADQAYVQPRSNPGQQQGLLIQQQVNQPRSSLDHQMYRAQPPVANTDPTYSQFGPKLMQDPGRSLQQQENHAPSYSLDHQMHRAQPPLSNTELVYSHPGPNLRLEHEGLQLQQQENHQQIRASHGPQKHAAQSLSTEIPQNLQNPLHRPPIISQAQPTPYGNSTLIGATVPPHQDLGPFFQSNLNMANGQFKVPQPKQNVSHGLNQTSLEGPSFVTFDSQNQLKLQAMDPFNSEPHLGPTSSGPIGAKEPYTAGVQYQEQNVNPTLRNQIVRDHNLPSSQSVPTSNNSAQVAYSSQDFLMPTERQNTSSKPNTQPYLTSALNGPYSQTNNQKPNGADLSQSLLKEAVGKPSTDENNNYLANLDESLMAKSFRNEQQATAELRQRLEMIARKQKNVAAVREGFAGGVKEIRGSHDEQMTGNTGGVPMHRQSPHVHFKEPLVVTNGGGLRQTATSGPPKKSPSVSPIPFKVPAVPAAKKLGVTQERRVVVNLPSAWSDVSSTMSL